MAARTYLLMVVLRLFVIIGSYHLGEVHILQVILESFKQKEQLLTSVSRNVLQRFTKFCSN